MWQELPERFLEATHVKISNALLSPRRVAGALFRLLPNSLKSTLLRTLHPRWRWIAKATGNKVVSGPFRGLQYVFWSVGSSLFPKLLGTYEKELWPVIESIVTKKYTRIIDIGAAEGYYAIGLATLLPNAHVVCFEAQNDYHPLLQKLASLNGVSKQIEVHGLGTSELLQEALRQEEHQLVICDIEGAEEQVLDPAKVSGLKKTDILVELHDIIVPGVSERIRERFEATHTIEVIASRTRTPADWPLQNSVSWENQEAYLSEHRPCVMEWFWMQVKS